ncbi:MAG: EAL domain-containing protein [Gammaproteobacteria bacterium]|uniref:EAL domain-containing response regulator n=1 Tax=Stutzerimonas xanthomarina TaxID=271420 RepID=UPI000E83EB12|nr:EAL domain-containing protein [Stutzerimonas xanthomarina]MBU0851262.1 EAL domain-containing protein [Gammaproteobacteria bacterium]HAW22561.1 ferrous iron transporter C [Pseudomonas sp.]MBK3849108.1 EAL domain-containing protein [Stutzerimonas xanthomarina]MBU1303102.1 EAL domain-containing protein [Gammaproteobacteria bacterium]MBU1460784.1 EAL domain-containing protein [Gammaproteobacteria bacterium]|tara:strand:- start:350 stop:2416 length:2067 start_codon:yes stop_codon:yes gene_type:complete
MAPQKKTIRLLILEDSQNEAERLVSLFRNAGQATRVHRLTSSEDLADVLQQTWDLLINAPTSTNLDPSEAIGAIRKQAKDIPVIQLIDGNDSDAITEALALGAQGALPQGEDEWLILVASRELANLEERRARRSAELALREAEKRCQLLLESSVDAIAYVHDGMHIYANRAYLELFGYEDVEELEGMPMIDLIASCDQGEFKGFLKNYQSLQGSAELVCGGVRADGSSFKASMHFSPASYDGEPCIQVVIRAESDNAELEKLREISSQDLVTGLYNRNHFLESLDGAVERAVNVGKNSSLAYIRIDRFASLQAEIGLGDSDRLLAELAQLLRRQFPQNAELARFGDDAFAVLMEEATPKQLEQPLTELLKKVEGHLFDVGGRTVQTSLSIGVAALDEQTAKARDVVDRAHRCAEELTDGNALRIYDPARELAAAASRGNVLAMLQQALEKNSFRLLFQPIISLRGDSHEHYEVLLRLLDPEGAEVPPGEFLDAAKEAGLASKIDRWVLLNSIKLLAEHRNKGHSTRLMVHLSGTSLQDPSLLSWLGAALKASRLPPDSLVFQLDENDAVAYLRQAKALTQGLAGLGCRVALNQFGCVLNPLNTLKHLDADFVKIDGSYTQDLSRQENQEALKQLLAQLHEQAKQTIVPFVDSATVLATLWQAGVGYIQGQYLQGPSQSMDYNFSSDED